VGVSVGASGVVGWGVGCRLIPIALLSAPATPALLATKGPTDRWGGPCLRQSAEWA
jgi:hypothetical protein